MDSKKLKKETILRMVANHEISALDSMVLLKNMEDTNENNTDLTLRYYKNWWVKKDSKEMASVQGKNGLIFDVDSLFYKEFKRNYSTEDEKVILVLKGDNFEIVGSHTIIMNPIRDEDYIKIFQYLKENNIKIDFILHLWSEENKGLPEELTQEILNPNIFSLLGLVKAAIAENMNNQITLLYVFRNNKPGENPLYQAAGAFARTARYEYPTLLFKAVEIISEKDRYAKEIINALKQELHPLNQQEIILRYHKGERYVRRLLEDIQTVQETTTTVLTKDGCLLITGGLGGLGLQLAGFLMKRYPNPIVLLGRKSASEAEDIICGALGGELKNLHYIKCDITKEEQVRTAIDQAVKTYGSINCVFHVAGTLIDKYLARKDRGEFFQVALPKIQGAINLYQCTLDNPPKKFVFFSSLAGIMGNIGQSDYAFSNSFLDCYSELLSEKGVFVSSINWPLWESGGMNISQEQIANYRVQSGQELLPSLTGFKAMESIMRHQPAQSFVSYGTKHMIPAFLNNGEDEILEKHPAIDKGADKEGGWSEKKLWEETQTFLKGIFSALLKLGADSMNPLVSFEEYGVDSLLINQFNQEMEEDFHKLSKSILFEYRNIYELSKYLTETRKNDLLKLFEKQQPKAQEISEIPLWEDLEPEISLENAVIGSKVAEDNTSDEIAIIGISGIYPGADNVEEFWTNLLEGRDSVSNGPQRRWNNSKLFGGTINTLEPGKSYSKWGGFLDHIDYFDPGFFHLSPREAEVMDPQERLFLETAWHLFEDAGYSRRELSNITQGKLDVGVFVGVTTNTYKAIEIEEYMKDNFIMTNSSEWSVANRVSYIMDFHGPSIAVDTACSSSLTALCLACDSLKNKTSSVAVVGGVNIYSHPSKYIQLCKAKMLSPTGKCHSFGVDGDGFTPGEGVGALLLKPLSRAKQDKDHIYGIIKGYSANHDGKTNGYTVPNPAIQAEAIKQAISNAKINAEEISYIEAHGTGTSLGDPIEVEGLLRGFGSNKRQFCALGSVKSNIGHTESAAGVAGITKILLQMKNKKLVSTLHSEVVNPNINFEDTPFYLQKSVSDWENLGDGIQNFKRIAGISSFGAGGSNAHVIIEEFLAQKYENTRMLEENQELILLSGKTEESLTTIAGNLLNYLQRRYNKGSNKINRIKAIISELLQVEINYLEDNSPFKDFGLDTFVCNTLQDRLSKEFHISVSVYDMEQAGTISGLSKLMEDTKDFVNTNGDTALTLRNISYTLMKGREIFENRLAVTVSSVEELIVKLKAFLNREKKEDIFIGRVINPENYMVQFEMNGGNTNEVNRYLQNRDLKTLAKIWSEGTVIEWEGLFKEKDVQRISLPLYPFDHKSYWVPVVTKDQNRDKEFSADLLHLQERDKTQNTLYLSLSGKEFFLTDHSQILPAAVYLEIAGKAGKNIKPLEYLREIQDVSILKSFEVSEKGGELKLIYKDNGTKIPFEIQGSISGNSWDTYCTGTLIFNQEKDINKDKEDINIGTLIESFHGGREIAEGYYCQIEALNAYAGHRLKGLKEFYYLGGEGLGVLKKAQDSGREGEFMWDPAVLDGGIRTADAFGFLLFPEDKRLHIPYTVRSMKIYAKGLAVYAHIKYISTKGNFDEWDIRYLDAQGKNLYSLIGLCTSRISLHAQLTDGWDRTYTEKNTLVEGKLQWVKNPLIISAESSRKKLLFFSFDPFDDKYLIEDLEQVFHSITVVNCAKTIAYNSKVRFRINTEVEADYVSLLKDLIKQDLLPDYVLYQSPFMESELSNADIEQGMNQGFLSLLFFLRSLQELNIHKEIKLLFLYSLSSTNNNPVYASLGALARTGRLENHNCRMKILGIDRTYKMESKAQLIRTEFQDNIYHPEVLYQSERKIKQFIKLELASNRQNHTAATPIKPGGTYLITGGAGGLGLMFAKYLGKNYAANIILVGSSPITGEKAEKRKDLLAQGLKVEYLEGDLGDFNRMKEVLSHILTKYGKLNGVIHSAGRIKDSMINNKSLEMVKQVISPKVWGLYNLISVLKDVEVDFILAFSSLSAVLGNVGQADYAYANSFMDHVAANERMNGSIKRLISINWPLWDKGGMSVSKATQKLFSDVVGMVPLTEGAGIRAFEDVLNSRESNVMVLEGDEYKILNTLTNQLFPDFVKEEKLTVDIQNIKEMFFNKLEEFTGSILKLDPGKIDRKLNISSFGFDSVSFAELSKLINDTFDTHVSPALFFGHQTLLDLAEYLYKECHKEIQAYYTKEQKNTQPAIEAVKDYDDFAPGVRIAQQQGDIEVAVIGMSGRFPGSQNLSQYWEHMIKGENQISEIPTDRWDWKEIYGDAEEDIRKTRIKWGGFLENIDRFDPLFFSISPKDAIIMDPQERMVIEEVYKAVEDAGYQMEDLSGSDTDVYIGMSNSDYKELLIEAGQPAAMTNSVSINRISYLFNLRGASEPIDTACSSSLVAIEKAYQSIVKGKTYAIAGGVNVIACPNLMILQSRAGMLSETGQCNTFDESANGYVRGEGTGILILKQLSKAVEDGDHIYGMIKGAGINHGGHGSSITAPNMLAQAELIANVYKEAGIRPDEVSYLETHGTGTRLGDPVEINGLKEAFRRLHQYYQMEETEYNYCALGAVKTLIGHLESASGVAGVMKVLLAMEHKQIPGLRSLDRQNKMIELDKTPFFIPRENIEWKNKEIDGVILPKIAGISSFGIGGVNAHIIIEEYIPPVNIVREEAGISYLIPLSAESNDQLKQYAQDLLLFLLDTKNTSIQNMAYVLQTGRKQNQCRTACIVENTKELIHWLQRVTQEFVDANTMDSNQPEAILSDTILSGLDIRNKSDLELMCKEWLKGKDIPWKSYYIDFECKPQRISLPTYPFKGERYWFTKKIEKRITQEKVSELLAENNSTLLLQQYSSYANLDTFYVKDHNVMGKYIVPGAVMIELMCEALDLGLNHMPFYFYDIVFIRPLEIVGDNTKIDTVLIPSGNFVTVKVGMNNEFFAVGHAAPMEGTKESLNLDIENIKKDCTESVEGEYLYGILQTHGLKLLDSFRSIHSIYLNSQEALAEISTTVRDSNLDKGFYLNPVLVDGAFQAILGRVDLREEEMGEVYLPYSVGKLLKYKELSEFCYGYVTKSEDTVEDNTTSFDIMITNREGEVLVVIQDYKVRRLEK